MSVFQVSQAGVLDAQAAAANVLDIQREISSVLSNPSTRKKLSASYDAAQTAYGNEAHWASADQLGPNNAAKSSVRKKLRSRSRYEIVENNPYLKGMILKICNSFTGSGPSLYITDDRIPFDARKPIIDAWNRYAKVIKLRQLCWRLRGPRSVDGESLAIAVTSDSQRNEVKANWRVIECDHLTGDYDYKRKVDHIDGIILGKDGETPESYYILNQHPGDNTLYGTPLTGQWVDANNVCHWFRKDRPWVRGIPEGVTSLPLCALLRRYTLAVVQAAEVAADLSVLLESEAPPSMTAFGSVSEIQSMTPSEIMSQWFDTFPMYRGMVMNLPWGMKASQMKAEQPTATYDKFVDALLREIAQPFLLPFNAAAGFSGNYNMASGTLDVQMWNDAISQDRYFFEEDILDPKIFAQWWFEAVRIPGYFDATIERVVEDVPSIRQYGPDHTWGWDHKATHPDPLRASKSISEQWDNGFITDEDIQTRHHNRSLAEWQNAVVRQNEFRRENDLPLPGVQVTDSTNTNTDNNNGDGENSGEREDD